ncbi:tape measure protein [Morganella morganii]|uniref:tape measure protein n=2 Tax=Morganella morganii TaxID=582 RepID=UPI00195A7FCA|nr:tape measure protein [Morganella morganii]MBM7212906.1 tape measure protein [Morganella morganii]MBN4018411.1 tape measure protein [Morganella morganii]QSB63651.1 tape measure protein [Morganella morganii]
MAQVGEIVYQVQMDVAQLLTSQRQLDQRLRSMEGGFNRTTTAVNGTERSMASLSRVAASLTAYLSVSAVASYAEAWTVLNNKLVNSIKAGETLAVVNQRVFDIAQNSRSSLDGIATLYSRLERAMRSAGLSGQELGQITTTISKAMTVSGATAAESEGALIQLSQALASGVLRGQEFNSMSEQAPALMKGLADSLGVSIGELRKMAGEGKLTTDVLLKAFREMGPTIEREFANTTQTMSQSLQIASNNITKFFGENTTVKTFTRIFNDSVVTISENLDGLTAVLTVAATVIGSRFAGAMALAAKEKIQGVIASRALSVAEAEATRSAELHAAAELRTANVSKQRALDELRLAKNLRDVAITENQVVAAEQRLSQARQAAAIATGNYNSALAAHTAAQNAAGVAANRASIGIGTALRGALSFIGGPAGLAVAAASALFYFSQRAKEARDDANNLADSVNTLIGKFGEMSRIQIAEEIGKAGEKIPELTEAVAEAQKKYDDLTYAVNRNQQTVERYGESTRAGKEAAAALAINLDRQAIAAGELDRAQQRLSQTQNMIRMGRAQLNGELLKGADLLTAEARTALPNAGAALRAYGIDLENATKAKQKFNSASLKVEWSDAGADMKKTLEREIEMAGAKDDVVKRQLQVKYYVEDKGISEQEAEKLAELAAKAGEASEAKKTGIKTSREAAAEAKKEATEAEKLKQKITDLANATKVAELETKGLSREAAILEAVQKLGSKANAAQIAEITELAGKEYDLTQKIKDRKDAFEQNPRVKADQDMKMAQEQLERQLKGKLVTEEQYQQRRAAIHAEYSRKISEETSNGQVNIVAENRAKIDPIQALANENAQKLALMESYYQAEQALLKKSQQDGQISHDQYIAAKQATDAQYLALKTAQDKQYQEQQIAAQWQLLSQQSLGYDMLTSAVDSLSGNASNAITGLITQTMSWSDAARSLGNTMLNSVVNSIVQVGVEMAKNFILGQTLGVATQAANATAAVAGGAAALAAWTPAAIAASIATMGAASASGLGAYTAAQATGAATSIGMKALTIAGARKDGGPVSAGEMYRVGEGGKPEIFKASNGNQYMIPGDNGKVISNRDIGGGQVPVTVNINDYSSGGNRIDAQARQDSNGMTIDVFIADMDNKGPMHSAITRNTTASARVR